MAYSPALATSSHVPSSLPALTVPTGMAITPFPPVETQTAAAAMPTPTTLLREMIQPDSQLEGTVDVAISMTEPNKTAEAERKFALSTESQVALVFLITLAATVGVCWVIYLIAGRLDKREEKRRKQKEKEIEGAGETETEGEMAV